MAAASSHAAEEGAARQLGYWPRVQVGAVGGMMETTRESVRSREELGYSIPGIKERAMECGNIYCRVQAMSEGVGSDGATEFGNTKHVEDERWSVMVAYLLL